MHHAIAPRRRQRHQHWGTGLILIALGTLFLLDRLGIIEPGTLRQYWPALIALVGLGRLVTAHEPTQRVWGGFLIFLAGWLYASIQHLWGFSFHTSWPLILIAVGVTHIVCALVEPRNGSTPKEPA